MGTASEAKLNSLQAGRALAAMAVVCLHAFLAAEAFGGSAPLGQVLEYGFIGVDFFFVLSGFIIYHSTVGRGKSAADYASSRARRIYLPYLPAGLAVAALYAWGWKGGTREWDWLTSLTLLPVTPGPALSVAWTLQHEILFYAIFGLLYFSGLLRIGIALWAIAIVGAALLGVDGGIPLALINLEFMMGMAAAVLAGRRWGPDWLYAAAILPFALWVALGAKHESSVLVGASFMMLILPTVRRETAGRFAVPNTLLFLGAASYSIYLVHNPLLSIVGRIGKDLGGTQLLLFGIAASTVAGCLYYLLVERPMLGFGKGNAAAKRATRPSNVEAGPSAEATG